MPATAQRRAPTASAGKGNTAGSGGRVRRGLEGKGPTPKAEDRPYHPAHRARRPPSAGRGDRQRPGARSPARQARRSAAEWVAGRNPVVEALRGRDPGQTAYVAEGTERDDRLRES